MHTHDPTNLVRDGVAPQFMALRQARPIPPEGKQSPQHATMTSADNDTGPVSFSSARAALHQGIGPVPMYEAPRSPPLSPSTLDNIPGPSTRPATSSRMTAHFPPSVAHSHPMKTGQTLVPSRPPSPGNKPPQTVKPHSSPVLRIGPTPTRTSKPHSERSSVFTPASTRSSKLHSQAVPPSEVASRRASYPSSSRAIIELTSDPPEAEPERAPTVRMPHSSTNCHTPPTSLPSSSSNEQQECTSKVAGTKRRLGMGRTAGGYSNKKFKTPAFAQGT